MNKSLTKHSLRQGRKITSNFMSAIISNEFSLCLHVIIIISVNFHYFTPLKLANPLHITWQKFFLPQEMTPSILFTKNLGWMQPPWVASNSGVSRSILYGPMMVKARPAFPRKVVSVKAFCQSCSSMRPF